MEKKEELMLLLKRRYNALKEVLDMTEELLKEASGDLVCVNILFEERFILIEKQEKSFLGIMEKADNDREYADLVKKYVLSKPEEIPLNDSSDRIIREIRERTAGIVTRLKDRDHILGERLKSRNMLLRQERESLSL